MNRVKVMELVKNILLAVAMVVTGVLFVIPDALGSDILLKLIIWAYAAIGAYMIVHHFVNLKELHRNASLVLGILLLVAGAYITLFEFYEFLLYFYPLVLAVAGALSLGDAMSLKTKGCKAWWQPLVLAIIQLAFATAYILLWRFFYNIDFVLVLGIELILDGIYLCVAQFLLKKECKEQHKEECKE